MIRFGGCCSPDSIQMCNKPTTESDYDKDVIRKNTELATKILKLFAQIVRERKSDPDSAFYENEQ